MPTLDFTVEQHTQNAIRQLRQGEKIGRRGTEVISFWPMRKKWEKWGDAWMTLGTDGDALVSAEDGWLIIPAVLRLVYFRYGDDMVCQLAYAIQKEARVPPVGNPPEAILYERARHCLPTTL